MKKSLSIVLLAVILINFIFCNNAYSDERTQMDDSIYHSDTANSVTPSSQESLISESKTTDGDSTTTHYWDSMGPIFGTIAGMLALVVDLFPYLIQLAMSMILGETFTIEKTVFNLFGLFDINYFNFSTSYTVGTTSVRTVQSHKIIKTLKEEIAKYFIIVRLIAISLSLLVLIYVGIRMALSSLSSDKAKYKKMLMAWVESMLLLFLMQYIISAFLMIGRVFGNIAYDLKAILDANGERSFEIITLDVLLGNITTSSGWTFVTYSIVYWFLIFIQTKFFLSYLRRVVVVGFLIMISPLISIIYPIDKVGDGKAQSFSVWMNELAINIFIQPIHAFIYLIFMYTAGEIAKMSTLVALVFLLGLTKVEKIILHLFNLKNVASLKPVDDERNKKI